jgi:tetratricopeptide (TPR) repeat protein
MYGRTLRDLRKFSAAAAEFWRVAKAKPESAEAWSELAGMLILLDNYPQALAALDRVRALGAETSAHYFFRAIILDKMRQLEPALESYEKFLATSRGKSPNEEFQARQRVRIIKKELNRQ